MTRREKDVFVVAAGLMLAALGVYNLVSKATWTAADDGVYWKATSRGLVALRVAPGGPGARTGVEPDDVLLAVDGAEVLSLERLDETLASRRAADVVTYSLLRDHEPRKVDLRLQLTPRGNLSAFYYLSLVGFFSLVVGTVVMLRRPVDRTSLHFYAICVLFFLTYSTSYTGRLDPTDWVLLWTDHLSVLLLPVVFLHFCLVFPERRLRAQRQWIVPALYMPALLVVGATAIGHVLLALGAAPGALWGIVETTDRAKPLY